MSAMFRQTPLRSLALIAALAGLAAYASLGGYYSREIVVEIAILAIMAVSLDVAAGFGGAAARGIFGRAGAGGAAAHNNVREAGHAILTGEHGVDGLRRRQAARRWALS